MIDEFSLIERYFAPLAGEAGLGLKDDAAVFTPSEGCQLVVTTDSIAEGVHYIGHESADMVAKKLVRTNLSDLAAMGANPLGYTVALGLSSDADEAWIAPFAKGLADDNTQFGVTLLGGDTIMHSGKMVLTLTAIGEVKAGEALKRSAASIGDTLYVTGTLGDSALGLALLQKKEQTADQAYYDALVQRYYLPEPRIALMQKISPYVNAAMDISDGLLQDASHMADASDVRINIMSDQLPTSKAFSSIAGDTLSYMLSGGDDYEILFTASSEHHEAIISRAESYSVSVTAIGAVVEGENVQLYDINHQPITSRRNGFKHL